MSGGSLRPETVNNMMRIPFLLLGLTLVASRRDAHADDWPQWRGPHRDAVSAETKLMSSWETEPRLAWRASGLGEGYASVVTSRGMVFTIGKHGNDVFLFALDSDNGRQKWARQIGTTARIPISTPTVDQDRVYALDPDGELVCLQTSSGDIVWQRSYLEDFGGQMQSGRGYGESPLIDGDRLICTPGGPEAMIAALDKRTGVVQWTAAVPELGAQGADGAGFSSIVISQAAGVRQYVQLVGRGLIGIEAGNGHFLWGYNSVANLTANIPTPLVYDDYVFAANGYHAGCALLRLVANDEGGVTAQEVYALGGGRFQNHHGGIVRIGDHVFGGHGSNNGLPTCVHLETGEIRWKRRGPGIGSAGVVYADGHLYFRYQNGLVALIEANPAGYRLQGSFRIPVAGGDSWAHPVVSHGRLFLREKDHLFVYDVRKIAAASPSAPTETRLAGDEIDGLRKLAVSMDVLGQTTTLQSADVGRLHRYLHDSADENTSILRVTLTNKHLSASGSIKDAVLEQLHRVDRPMVLNLAGTRLDDAGLEQASEFRQLIGLNLELCQEITDAGLQELRRADQLRALWLTGTQITDEGVEALAPIPTLVALDLEICDGVTDTSCAALGSMKQLKALVLKKTGFESERITDIGLGQLSQLTNLELLDLYGNLVTDAGAEHLGQLASLRELDLSLVAITDAGLPHLTRLGRLQHLSLLSSVGMGGSSVTDAGAETLRALTSLRSLDLTGSRVTDDGIRSLAGLTQLERLKLVNSDITPDGLSQINDALPNCVVTP
jgi:outer membrane protein assembly factor BamB